MSASTESLSLPELSLDHYRIANVDRVMTPALAIYPEIIEANIRTTLRLVGENANRLRPHVKTAKLAFTMRRFIELGITNFKCSTSLELLTACESGAADVLVAYPLVGAGARRIRKVAAQFEQKRISALVECREQIGSWEGSNIGLFIDVNPGMNRTGIEQDRTDEIIKLARVIQNAGLAFRGLHYYDGHLSSFDLPEREKIAHRGYERLMEAVAALERAGINVVEVITAGTPAFPCTLSYSPFWDAQFIHRASPGTVVYNDCSSLAQLPSEYDYRPAAIVLTTVVSHPSAGRFTCDAGHKTVSADAGIPNCAVIGRPDFVASKPSEEHLPIDVTSGSSVPVVGDVLYLIPKHICPTVNNFDHALIVDRGEIVGVESVTARGREAPLIED